MLRRRLGTVDLDTGELVEGVSVISVQQRPKLKEAFVLVFQKGLERLALDKSLRGQSLRVLMALMSKLDYENFIHVSQQDIADLIHVDRSSVARGISQLLARGVIIAGPKVGTMSTYRLSDTLGWKGRVTSLQDARQKRNLAMVRQHTERPK